MPQKPIPTANPLSPFADPLGLNTQSPVFNLDRGPLNFLPGPNPGFNPFANGPGQGPGQGPIPRGADPENQLIFRSIDGSGNNLLHTDMNAVGTDFIRIGTAHFADGISAMRTDLPNARTISNVVVAGSGDVANKEGLSGMMYAWGQFVDHDLDLSLSDGKTSISINIPGGDVDLSASMIPMTRAQIDPLTGVAGKPATAVNTVSGWLDASQIYGSSAAVAASLRTADGHLLTSADNNLPVVDGKYLAGDIRVQENPDLTSLQTLFLREHNYQVDQLSKAHPNWSAEQLYQQAKAIVTAEMDNITYSEFLPHLLGKGAITPYHGYNPNVNATISEEFAGAAFRFGHSIVSANLQKMGEFGQDVGEDLSLKDAFFQSPTDFAADGGAAGHLRHLAGDLSNALDVHIIDDLRNFLDVPPVAMDLAAINIQRGRDLGLGTLNETRAALNLKTYTDFSEITSDAATALALKQAYGSVDRIDLWVGGLAEDHMNGAMLGQTFGVIVAQQFANLRDGDRYWFENQGFDRATLNQIKQTTLSDLILRNTDTVNMQDDAFVYYERHTGLAGGIAAENPDAPQLIIGSDGIDTLIGGIANDILVAGSQGLQTLTGGRGADLFIFEKANTSALITDFRVGQDQIEIQSTNRLGFNDLHIMRSPNGNGTMIEFAGNQVTLTGINLNDLRPGDFVFTS
jgi:hypothetical protein